MLNKKKYIFIFSFLLFFSACGQSIQSFNECIKAGNPVIESSPRQCKTKGGEIFLEKIKEAVAEYKLEKTTENTCAQNADCILPEEYALSSICPYESLCIQSKCTIICPLSIKKVCQNSCGNKICQDSPCGENNQNCPQDCSLATNKENLKSY